MPPAVSGSKWGRPTVALLERWRNRAQAQVADSNSLAVPGKGQAWRAYLMLTPALVVFGVFVFYPLVRTFWLGTQRIDPFGINSVSVGLDQYIDTLKSTAFHRSVITTFKFVLLTVPPGLALGLLVAVLAHKPLRGIGFFRGLFSSTVASSVAVASVMWLALFNANVGAVPKLLNSLGWVDRLDLLGNKATALPAVAASTVWLYLGATFIIISAGLQAIPDEMYEAADIDGASAWAKFRHVTLPLLTPVLLFVVVMLTINAFQTFGQIHFLTHGGPGDTTRVLVYSIYQDARENFDDGRAAVQAVFLFFIMILIARVQLWLLERRVHYGQ